MKIDLRSITLIGFLFIISSCQKEQVKENDFTMPGLVEIKNKELRNVIVEYYNQNLTEENTGIVTVDFYSKADTSLFYISITYNKAFLKDRAPGFYSVIDGVPILFFTGLEHSFTFDSLYLSNLDSLLSSALIEYEEDDEGYYIIPPSHMSPQVWKIEMSSGKVTKKEKLN